MAAHRLLEDSGVLFFKAFTEGIEFFGELRDGDDVFGQGAKVLLEERVFRTCSGAENGLGVKIHLKHGLHREDGIRDVGAGEYDIRFGRLQFADGNGEIIGAVGVRDVGGDDEIPSLFLPDLGLRLAPERSS